MKKVSVSLDEDLLRQIDDHAEVSERGRSAVLREAVITYLAHVSPSPARASTSTRPSNEEIVRRYREGYGKFPPTEDELNGWEDEEAWSNE